MTYFRPQRVLQDTPICRRTNLVSWSLPLATPLLLFPVPLPSAALFTATMLKAAVDSAETDVVAAQGETTKAIGAEEDDGDGTTARPPPKSVMNSDQEYMLESTAKKARKAGNSLPQVSKSTRVQRICQFKRYITHRELRYSHPIEPYFKTSRKFLSCNASKSYIACCWGVFYPEVASVLLLICAVLWAENAWGFARAFVFHLPP